MNKPTKKAVMHNKSMSSVDKSSHTTSSSSGSRNDKPYYRGNGGNKMSRGYNPRNNHRNGNKPNNRGNESTSRNHSPSIDLSNIELTEEEKKDLDLKNLKSTRTFILLQN